MVQLHAVGGNANTSFGVYLNKSLIEQTGLANGDSLRVTAVDDEFILVTPERMPIQQWIELYNSATSRQTADEMTPAELVTLLEVAEGEDGRRPSSVTSLAPLGDSGHRILITNAVARLQLPVGADIQRRVGPDIVVLVPVERQTESVKQRIRDVLDTRASQ
jgi:antitoxin component of MazEF toxin-antitoxin module